MATTFKFAIYNLANLKIVATLIKKAYDMVQAKGIIWVQNMVKSEVSLWDLKIWLIYSIYSGEPESEAENTKIIFRL